MTTLAALDRLIAQHRHEWPDGIAVGTAVAAEQGPMLFPSERAAISGAVKSRQAEFAAGRTAARAALARLGVPPVAIPAGRDRAPIWPTGITGSISHTQGLCIAVVARLTQTAALGIDIELLAGLTPDLIDMIATPQELALVPADCLGTAALRIFSLKEAAYKAQYSLSRTQFDFSTIRLTSSGPRFTRDIPPFEKGTLLPGQQWTGEGLCLSLCVLTADSTYSSWAMN